MKHILPAFAILIGLSGGASGDTVPTGDLSIIFSPASEVYPPGADAFQCQLGSGTTAPCVIFSGTITDFDTDGSFITLATAPTISAYSNYFTVDENTFFDTPGFYEGDTDDYVTSNTYGPGPIIGLDIAPDTPAGIYTAEAIFAGEGGTDDPNFQGFTIEVPFTVVIAAPEPAAGGLTIAAGMLAIAASLRNRRSRTC